MLAYKGTPPTRTTEPTPRRVSWETALPLAGVQITVVDHVARQHLKPGVRERGGEDAAPAALVEPVEDHMDGLAQPWDLRRPFGAQNACTQPSWTSRYGIQSDSTSKYCRRL